MKKLLAIQTCRSGKLVDWLSDFYKTSIKRYNHPYQTLDQIEDNIKNEFTNVKNNYDYVFIEISGTRFLRKKFNKEQFLDWYEHILKLIPINTNIIVMGPSNVLLTDSHVNHIMHNKREQNIIVKRDTGMLEEPNNNIIQNKRLTARVNLENWLQVSTAMRDFIFLKLSECFSNRTSSQIFKSGGDGVDTFHYRPSVYDILIKYTQTKLQ